MSAFWDTAPCIRVELDRRLRGAYFLYHHLLVLITDALCISETSVYFYETTWCNITEDCTLHALRHQNLVHCSSTSYVSMTVTHRTRVLQLMRALLNAWNKALATPPLICDDVLSHAMEQRASLQNTDERSSLLQNYWHKKVLVSSTGAFTSVSFCPW
jgi:hypothetical protein